MGIQAVGRSTGNGDRNDGRDPDPVSGSPLPVESAEAQERVLTKSEVKRLFEECGVEDEKLQNFDEQYELAAGEKSSLVASNITNTRKFEIKTPDVVIHVAPDRADLVETRIIDGRKCLVIPMESEVELNGIRVSALNSVEDASTKSLPVNDSNDINNSDTEEEIPF